MPDNSRPDEKCKDDRTPLETLLWVLTDIEKVPAGRLMVIYTNQDGDVCWSASGPYSFSHMVGLLACVEAMVKAKFMAGEYVAEKTPHHEALTPN
jgi:hypothetical protein